MKKILFLLLAVSVSIFTAQAKTLIAYYSYTGNIDKVVNALKSQVTADIIRIEPAEKGLDYEANGYAIGSALISAIRNNPNDVNSYPGIDPISVNLDLYDTIIIGTPLWWSNMAAPMQTFLFKYGGEMADKTIGLIVSSHSSGISGVVSDAKRLIPNGKFVEPLWIRSLQTDDCELMLEQWIDAEFPGLAGEVQYTMPEEVDLGLSLNWASTNMQADYPEGFGGYYGWADPTGTETTMDVLNSARDWVSDLYGGTNPPENISGTDLDIAHVKLGEGWRLPTLAEMQELAQCQRTWTYRNGVNGYEFKGANGNSIFLPAGGARNGETYNYVGAVGYYWTGTLGTDSNMHRQRAHRLYIGAEGVNTNPAIRYSGFNIRPVRDRNWSGISDVIDSEERTSDKAIYDIMGRRLQSIPSTGIYIQNGKKFIAK